MAHISSRSLLALIDRLDPETQIAVLTGLGTLTAQAAAESGIACGLSDEPETEPAELRAVLPRCADALSPAEPHHPLRRPH